MPSGAINVKEDVRLHVDIVPGERDEASQPVSHPFVPSQVHIRELTIVPLLTGIVLGLIFGTSSLYLVLKGGITVSASIPLAVISIALFRLFSRFGLRDSTILENKIIQTAGAAGEPIATLRHDKPVLDAAFDLNDNQKVVTASADNAVHVWQWGDVAGKAAEGGRTGTIQNSAPLIITGNAQLTDTFRAYSDWVTGLSFTRDGKYLLTTCYDGTAIVRSNRAEQEKLETYPGPIPSQFSPWTLVRTATGF